ncbi:MAG: AraC family transcriptional regulator [Solirubrobacterales bacterium]
MLAREHIGSAYDSIGFESWLEPPQPVLTLMISLEDPLRTERGVLPRAWIAGLDDRPEVVASGGRHTELDLKLTPVGAYVLCGIPLQELSRQIVPLEEIFGRRAKHLPERLAGTSDWDSRFKLVERLLLGHPAGNRAPDPVVVEAHSRLLAADGRLRIGRLAADLQVSRRHLSTRFHAQLGVPPKTMARLLRFDLVRRQMARHRHNWADVAALCGFADQSHLNREFRELAGTTPESFLARQLPSGGTLGDGITFLQDEADGST